MDLIVNSVVWLMLAVLLLVRATTFLTVGTRLGIAVGSVAVALLVLACCATLTKRKPQSNHAAMFRGGVGPLQGPRAGSITARYIR